MSNPVTRAGTKPTYNEALSAGSGRTFAENVPVREPPPPAVERVSRKEEVSRSAKKAGLLVVEHKGAHKVSHEAEKIANFVGKNAKKIAPFAEGAGALASRAAPWAFNIAKGASGASMLSMMYNVYSTISGPPSMNESDKARVRELFSQATALMAQGTLPKDYVQARVVDESAARGRLHDALESLRVRLKSPEKAETAMLQFKKEAEQSAFSGMEFAAAYRLHSPAALDGLLAKDASFRERFQGDLAFQEGVRAMVWLGQHRPAEFESRSALYASRVAPQTAP